MGTSDPGIVELRSEQAGEVIDVFCDAFGNYAMMRFTLGGAGPAFADRVHALIKLFVMRRALAEHPMLAIREGDRCVAGATLTPPGDQAEPAAVAALAEETWDRLGDDVRARYLAFAQATRSVDPGRPNLHLNMFGVRHDRAGRGLGRRLIDEVHRRSARDPASTGVSLTTETEANVAMYEHLGYELVGRARIGDGLETWGFFRPDGSGC